MCKVFSFIFYGIHILKSGSGRLRASRSLGSDNFFFSIIVFVSTKATPTADVDTQ
ncbi:MAG: hypothetical protein N4A57_08695 [Anaeromicrobium sp.]|nr:hypothetical protein [Anaeromicrobium sp.]